MDQAGLDQLSGAALAARLAQRGVPPRTVAELVRHRKRVLVAREILWVLNGRRKQAS